ncbi:MAG: S9 family peptidase [Flavobacteriales bacterium]
MRRITLLLFIFLLVFGAYAQNRMTPELLWKLGRLSAMGITRDGKSIIYSVSYPDVAENKSKKVLYSLPVAGGAASEIASADGLLNDRTLSPDGSMKLSFKKVKVNKVHGKDFYPELDKSNAQIWESLHYKHWDSWRYGEFNHLFLHSLQNGQADEGVDLMPGEPYDCPTSPFGDESDFTWSPDGKKVVYVCKKLFGTAYATSTNTDLYEYDLASGKTRNLTPERKGYDVSPAFSSRGQLAWLSMARDGYEADKNDIIVSNGVAEMNLTQFWDGTVKSFRWADDARSIFFIAPVKGTVQLFEVDYPGLTKKLPVVRQITDGDFDVNSIVGFAGNQVIVTRTDMNTAPEIYAVDMKTGSMRKLTSVNDALYANIKKSRTERRIVKTTDGKQMLAWVIYPPDFDPKKKYPTLLYCQGGPQSALTQFYSYRWNFQLMAAEGYIVVAPNRRGMPGHGVEWNEQISGDWGGQVMRDYLSAIDDVAKESYVDKNRLGAVGASYGGYSVFYLAGIHQKRFKTFIAHAGVFNLESMYGTTEEVFFTNWDIGGAYWEKGNDVAQKTYKEFNPIHRVGEWDTPILIIHGGKDFRVPEGQGFEAFQAAQLRGIKSKLLYFPDENHWILQSQNALIWQREFFKWLKETL